MPPKSKKKSNSPPPEPALTLTAGRSRRTIKPNRKYLNDSVVLANVSSSKSSSRSSSSSGSEDEYHQDEEDERVVEKKSTPAGGRKSLAAAKKTSPASTGRPRGRPPKPQTKTEPVKNLRKEVLKKVDLATLSVGKARVVLTPLKHDPKRKLNLDESIGKEKTPVKEKEVEKEAPKPKFTVKSKEEKVAASKPKPEVRVIRKGIVEVRVNKDVSPKRVINPVAVKKQQVEKSILDKRAKQVGESDDDDDEVQIVGISRETNPQLGRKAARKSPLVAKQISPLARKVPGKATPPVASALKRKASDLETDESAKKRASKSAKLSITLDSDDDDKEEEEEAEPVRRTTRSSLPSDRSSAASTPHNSPSVMKAKESPASAGGRVAKTTELPKSTLTRTISMPTLDKTKGKPVQTLPTRPEGLSKPMAASTPKPAAAPTKSKSEVNLADPIRSPQSGSKLNEKGKKSATIRIVDIGDIIKKSKSTPDIRKETHGKSSQEEYSEDSEDSDYEDHSPDKSKTNNELVATILERKRPINLEHLRGGTRPQKRGRPPAEKPAPRTVRQSVINLADDDIDFEDMLTTNIVTANKVQKVMHPASGVAARRGRPPASDENTNKTVVPSSKSPATSAIKTLASSNNNNVYKSNNNGRFGSTSSLNRSGSASPHKNPPRILNSTMKLGDNRPFAKLVSNSGNKHYSIDLTDPDNNVKLVASPDSPPPPPVKRSPVKAIQRPPPVVAASGGLRNASNALNKPVGGAVQRSVSSLTSTVTGSSPKMKKITCYETW